MIGKFLSDTIDLLVEAASRLGLLRGGPNWWRERLRRRLGRLEQRTENLRRSVAARHKMCPECRALVPVRARSCPECGAGLRRVESGGWPRLVRMLAPGFGSVSLTLVGFSVTVYVAMALATARGGLSFSLPAALLLRLGAKVTPLIVAGEWWRLVNPIFLHGSVLHIAFNAYALANLGPVIEDRIGGRRFLVLYVGTGVLSFVASTWLAPGALSVGSSGALFGLIGFGIVHGYRSGGRASRLLADQLVRWALFGVILLLVPGVDHAAHAGGFVSGALLGWMLGDTSGDSHDRLWSIAATIAALLPVAGFLAALLRGVTGSPP